MSCESRSRQYTISAAKRNGIAGYASRYLNTIGSWTTYRDLSNLTDVPGRLADVTEAFFGLKGLLSGKPKLAGVMGAMLAVHAAEQASGAVATMGMRLFGRGKPMAKYRGVILRETQPNKLDQLAERLSGGRLSQAKGFYFFESGRTWRCATVETAVGDTRKSLTTLRSYTLPGREFYFDRQIEPQQLVDVALGDRDPDSIPGFIGSVNELENTAVPFGNLKRAVFMADWLLRDQTERDSGPDFVDYDLLGQGGPSSSSGGYYQVSNAPRSPLAPAGSGWSSRPPPSERRGGSSSATGTTTRSRPPLRSSPLSDAPRSAQMVNVKAADQRPKPVPILRPAAPQTQPPPPPPNFPEEAGQTTPPTAGTTTVHIDGQDRTVVVDRLVKDPLNQTPKADARYYDDELKTWRHIVDDELRRELAQAVTNGSLRPAEG